MTQKNFGWRWLGLAILTWQRGQRYIVLMLPGASVVYSTGIPGIGFSPERGFRTGIPQGWGFAFGPYSFGKLYSKENV